MGLFCCILCLLRPLEDVNAPIAQSVERLPFKEMVIGSNPIGRTKDTNTGPAAGFVLLCEPERCQAIAWPHGHNVRTFLIYPSMSHAISISGIR